MEPEDRQGVLAAFDVDDGLQQAVETMFGDDLPMKQYARKYVAALAAVVHAKTHRGFHREALRRSRREQALEIRDALLPALDFAKTELKHAETPPPRWYEAQAKKVASVIADVRTASVDATHIKQLARQSARTVANTIAAKAFGLNVDDLKLANPRVRAKRR